ncbi:MAG: hypothetical protein HKN58_01340, partial [Xanthomonadales bacterium]|nr:hypothetical protein [Xanthomonadales bacterium]
SIDGGKTFEYNPVIDCCAPGNTVHIDNHAFWINPDDPRHLIIGNDGGIAISRDRGETWRFVRNLPLAQFYHIRVDNEHPYNVYGGLQDNGSWRGPAEIWVGAGIRNLHWQEVGFGDGFDTIPDPENARAGYVMSQGGFLLRYNLDTGEQKLIRPAPPSPDVDLRFNWSAGFAQDPFDPATIYYGSQFLHKSTDRGLSWAVISDDLTSNDPELQTFRESGGLTPDVTAAENYTTIVSVAASPLQRGVLWVGTDDGRVHVTRDGGENWTRVDERARGVPAGAWVPMIAPSPHDAGTAFLVFDDHRRGNMATYAYRLDNYGQRWTRLSADGLRGYAHSVLQDPVDPGLVFLGTEFGLYFSTNGGESWTRFKAGVPTVSVMDMAIQQRENDLVLGTHGRSVLVIDDYSALRDLESADFDARLRILSATPGQQYETNPTASTRFTGSGEYRGPNEPRGVLVTFMASGNDLPHPDAERERERKIARRTAGDLVQSEQGDDDKNGKDADAPKVTVRVRDADGTVIRTFEHAIHQGINRLAWGMQIDGVRPAPGNGDNGGEDSDILPPGPEVVPGQYRLELEFDGTTDGTDVSVLGDPRYDLDPAEHQARFDTLVALQGLEQAHVSALERIVHARDDVKTLTTLISKRLEGNEDEALKALKKQATEVRKGLDGLEKRFRTPPETTGIIFDDHEVDNQLGTAAYYVASATHAPSPTAEVYISLARDTLASALGDLNAYMDDEVAALRAAVNEAGIGLLEGGDPLAMPQ